MNITEILSITDTRDVIEQNDRFIPVSGTGDKHTCEACGRLHEVHAQVRLEDGDIKTVGTGCMLKQTFVDSDIKAVKGKINAYKRLAILKAELNAVNDQYAKNAELDNWAENTRPKDVMPTAELTHEFYPKLYIRTNVTKVSFGDVWIIKEGKFPEDITAIEWVMEVQKAFFDKRKSELGYVAPYMLKTKKDLIEKKIAKCLEVID